MTGPAYPAAVTAATLIHSHFTRHLEAARAAGADTTAPVPDVATTQALLEAAFWASLRREEGYAPRISLAFVSPDQVPRAVTLERPIPLAPNSLTRVAPAVERPGIHLGVTREADSLWLWGATRQLPPFSFVLEVSTPGVLVVKHSRGEDSGKFVNIAVLEGDQIKIVDEAAALLPDCPSVLMSLLSLESQFDSTETSASVLTQMAVSMRAHGRGGALLVVSSNNDQWRESILQPITYAVQPPFSGLSDLMVDNHPPKKPWQDSFRRAVDGIAGLTAVDGATILTERYELLAFGAKIVRRPKSSTVDRVLLTEPVIGAEAQIVEPGQLGGTRHLSAAQFAHDQHGALAMVASQDGRFTVFAWSSCENMVHAHRIETLLL
jgi:hypothetical protein